VCRSKTEFTTSDAATSVTQLHVYALIRKSRQLSPSASISQTTPNVDFDLGHRNYIPQTRDLNSPVTVSKAATVTVNLWLASQTIGGQLSQQERRGVAYLWLHSRHLR
jgi:hypothetical protein